MRALAALLALALLPLTALATSPGALVLAGEGPAAAAWVEVGPEDWYPDPAGRGYRFELQLRTTGLGVNGTTVVGVYDTQYGSLDGFVYAYPGDFRFSYGPWSPDGAARRFLVVVGQEGPAHGTVAIGPAGVAPAAWDATGSGTRAGRVYRGVDVDGRAWDYGATGSLQYEVLPVDPVAGRAAETVRMAYDHDVDGPAIHHAELRSISIGSPGTSVGWHEFDDDARETRTSVFGGGVGQAYYLLGGRVEDRASAELVVRTTPRGAYWDYASVATLPVDPKALGARGPWDGRFGGVEPYVVPDEDVACLFSATDGPAAVVTCLE